ncbi:recombinase RecT [Micrococcus luteus]|uniref:recombinase RecT n=1 Tax=Micrococcus luteus TaxID=1270 RepID=UPI00342D5A6D
MTSTTVARTEPTLAQLIDKQRGEIARALPRHMTPDRMARIAITVIRQNDKLAACTPVSLLGALMTASQLGLEPGPTGEAYLVPYGRECTFIPGYRGLIKLARNSGMLIDIWAEIVYENDHFKQTLGLHRDLQHEPAEGERGKPTHVYAAARLKDGGTPFVVMTHAEVEAIRKRSRASGNGPWVTDWNAMAKKTLIKQLAKWLPLSAEFNGAVALDGNVRTDVGDLADVVDAAQYVEGEVEAPAIGTGEQPTPENPEVRVDDEEGRILDAAREADEAAKDA